MGLLDDAIREHLELKRRRGADPDEVAAQENEALGDPRASAAEAVAGEEGEAGDVTPVTPEPELPPELEDDEAAPLPADEERDTLPEPDEPELEETPDFLQETPDHDRLWFEQKPPRDFDFDN